MLESRLTLHVTVLQNDTKLLVHFAGLDEMAVKQRHDT